jgi:DNA-binding MarR family transcriptional regulator
VAAKKGTSTEQVSGVLRAYNSTLMLAEPLLLDLWQELGLTVAQIRTLRWLQSRGPMGAGQLAERTQISPASLARILAKLEDDEMITRNTLKRDRRRVTVEITSLGRDTLRGRGILRGTLFELAAEKLDPTLRQQLTDALDAFHAALEEVATEDDIEYPRDHP